MPGKNGFQIPNTEETLEIMKVFDESEFDELHLEMGDYKLMLGKGRMDSFHKPWEPSEPQKMEDMATEASSGVRDNVSDEPAADISEPALSADEAAFDNRGLFPIKSPMLGIFYRGSKPGAPPFVEKDSLVNENDTVCLIEVMKLFNTVKSSVRGRVVEICAENNQMVEFNQTLFLVEPEAP